MNLLNKGMATLSDRKEQCSPILVIFYYTWHVPQAPMTWTSQTQLINQVAGHHRPSSTPFHRNLQLIPTTETKIINSRVKLTVLKLQNLGQPNTNCTASNKLLFPLPFLPTTQFISGEKGWISGCCLKERKFERVTDLMCILGYYYVGQRKW